MGTGEDPAAGKMLPCNASEGNMDANKRKDNGLGASVASFLMLVLSVVVGAFSAADIFATESSGLAGGSQYGSGQ
jgi:hypothetical protein